MQIISDLVTRIDHTVMAIRLERANQLATTLVIRQRTRQMAAVVEQAAAAGVCAAA